MWTEITRPKHDRRGLRHASDLTDAEWRVIEPHMPPPKALGRLRTTDLRALVNAILHVLRSGCCRRTSRRVRRCSAISPCGGMTACGRGSITRS